MSLNKRVKRKPVGKMANQKEYPKLTMEQAIDLVMAGKSAEGLRERTLKDYKKDWGYFVTWLQKNYEIETVDELSPQIFRDYINYLKYDAPKYDGHKYIKNEQGIGLSDTTINIRLRVYRAMFNYLEREDLIEINPMTNVRLLKQDIDLTNCFTDDEVKEVLRQPNQRDYVGFRDYVAMMLLLDSGIRANELLSLRTTDIDFQTRFITLGGDKNKNRKPRLVPISAHTVKLLLQLINENKKHFSTDRIFLSSYGEPLGQNQFNKRLKYYGEKAGIEGKKVTAHVYRHTWAKNMTLNGCDAFTLQKMGGWSDIRTMRRYIQMDVEDIRKSHDEFSPVMKLVHKKS
ncbi:tyrosine-type recombinase/integrase [Metabacillus fastidiosus]|uniref:tyrosine-type recombinase/integrase n=1 Tax=Metabacillus fastidiosus TaxID=1458 RepID=UPI002DBA84AB|nr:tyrosine-type recombinase/integrase [Metabacillus fastidiosus]MEC2076393.1 tyrosine-type recombinase/integrase [Metabacillus fastidiosus]